MLGGWGAGGGTFSITRFPKREETKYDSRQMFMECLNMLQCFVGVFFLTKVYDVLGPERGVTEEADCSVGMRHRVNTSFKHEAQLVCDLNKSRGGNQKVI